MFKPVLLASALITIVAMSAGCAPPQPEEEVGESNDALRGAPSQSGSADFVLKIKGSDYAIYRLVFARYPDVYTVPENQTTLITDTLHITIDVPRDDVGKVKGCAGAFSANGLSAAQIAAKDKELLRACARPTVVLDGREDWTTIEGSPRAERAELKNDASPYVTFKQHLVYVFELNGRTRSYIFTNWRQQ